MYVKPIIRRPHRRQGTRWLQKARRMIGWMDGWITGWPDRSMAGWQEGRMGHIPGWADGG